MGKRILLIDEEFDSQSTSTAKYLAVKGKKVEIITRLPYVGVEINFTSFGPQMQRLRMSGAVFTPMTCVNKI